MQTPLKLLLISVFSINDTIKHQRFQYIATIIHKKVSSSWSSCAFKMWKSLFRPHCNGCCDFRKVFYYGTKKGAPNSASLIRAANMLNSGCFLRFYNNTRRCMKSDMPTFVQSITEQKIGDFQSLNVQKQTTPNRSWMSSVLLSNPVWQMPIS